MEMLDSLSDGLTTSMTPELIDEKVASMSCKAAVKGNNKLSSQEMDALIGELLSLEQSIPLSSWKTHNYSDDKKRTGKEV